MDAPPRGLPMDCRALAEQVLRAAAAGDPHFARRAIELAGAVLDAGKRELRARGLRVAK